MTTESVFGLTITAIRYLALNKYLCICFHKGFHWIKHDAMTSILSKIGSDGKDVNIIRNLYWNKKGTL